MAIIPAIALTRRAVMRGGLLALPLAAAMLTGCVTTHDLLPWKAEKPAEEPVCQIACTWQNSVQFVPDPTRNGNPSPGLTGRLYLFGKVVGQPLQTEGSLVVDLFDETSGKPVQQEQWRIDPETLQRLVSKDFLGTGYTLFLPWSRYKPETNKIRLRVGFTKAKSPSAVFTENAITLADDNGIIREGTGTMPPMSSMPSGPTGPPGLGGPIGPVGPVGPLGVNPRLPMLPPPAAVK